MSDDEWAVVDEIIDKYGNREFDIISSKDKEPVKESVKEPVKELVKEQVKESVKKLVKEPVKEPVKESDKEILIMKQFIKLYEIKETMKPVVIKKDPETPMNILIWGVNTNTTLPRFSLSKKCEFIDGEKVEYWKSRKLIYLLLKWRHVYLYKHCGFWHLNYSFSPGDKKCFAFLKSSTFPKSNQIWHFSKTICNFNPTETWHKAPLCLI